MVLPVWKEPHQLSVLKLSTTSYGGGYLYTRYPEHPYATAKGLVPLHRLVVENHVERYLLPKEEVHHRDLDKANNEIENLELCDDASDHMRKHYQQGTVGFDRKIEWPTDGEMVQLLDSMSVGSVARRLGVYRESVTRWCHRHGYEPKPGKYWQFKRTDELRPSKEELERLVLEMSLLRISERFDVSHTTAVLWCQQLAVELPPLGYWHQKELPERSELQAWLEQSTVTAAATHYGTDPDTIVRWAKRLNLSWNSTCGARKKHREIDDCLFYELHEKVMAGQLAVWEAEVRLSLPEDGFSRECHRRGLPNAKNCGLVGRRNKIQLDVQKLQEVAACVRAGELSLRAASTRMGVERSTFKRHCAKHNIRLPLGGTPASRSKSVPLRKELLRHLTAGSTRTELARRYSVSRPTLNKWIRYRNLTEHANADKHSSKTQPVIPPTEEELKRLLWELPQTRLSERLGVSCPTLRSWIKKLHLADDLPPRGYWIRKS